VAKKRTGLGINAFFPPPEEEPIEPKPPVKRPRSVPPQKKAADQTKKKKATASQATRRKAREKEIPRRTAWLREDHLDRLEALKRKEKARLRADPNKRVAVSTLIDEAIERYLEEME
jgi:hypothetical protein